MDTKNAFAALGGGIYTLLRADGKLRMCTRCLRYLAEMVYSGLEGAAKKERKRRSTTPLIRPNASCMVCAGPGCQFCKRRASDTYRYANMYAESLKTPCTPIR
jgi:hypothetical protein